ncbi:MAG: DUF6402 family protein [Pseudomonadota bacterium]
MDNEPSKLPYYTLGGFIQDWKLKPTQSCSALDVDHYALSLAKAPPPFLDQPPLKPPTPAPVQRESKSLIEGFIEFRKWLNTPTPPKPAPAPKPTHPVVTPFDLQDIPLALDNIGWPMSAKVMRKWFAGELNCATADQGTGIVLNQHGNPFPSNMIDTTMFKLKWILGFTRAKSAYKRLLETEIYNPATVKILRKIFLRQTTMPYFQNAWELSGGDMQNYHLTFQFQRAVVDFDMNDKLDMFFKGMAWPDGYFMDDLYGSLGAFSLNAAVDGFFLHRSSAYRMRAEIKRISIYMRDVFTFFDRPGTHLNGKVERGSQYLGHWNKYGFIVVPSRFGNTHLPRIGQEVVVAYLGGDPDRPIIVGVVNNQENLPAWNLPDQHALSGYQSKELFGEGRNQTLYDDTQGQQQVQVASAHQNSLLALGHNVRVNDWQGREEKRGEGFELRTDGKGAIRADGMLITTEARHSADGHVLAMQETIRRLEQALAEARNVLDASVAALAQTDEQKNVAQAIAEQNDAIKGTGEALGELSQPMMVMASPAGIASTTPKTTHLHSGDHTALTTGRHLSMSAGHSIVGSAAKGVSLCGHTEDVKLIARKGKVAVQAQDNEMEVVARDTLKVTSTEGRIEVTAAREIVFNVGGTYYRMTPSGIESGTSGAWTVHAGSKQLTGPKTAGVAMPSFGKGYEGFYKLHWDGTDHLAPHQSYRITRADGSLIEGVTNAHSETALKLAEFGETVKIEIL